MALYSLTSTTLPPLSSGTGSGASAGPTGSAFSWTDVSALSGAVKFNDYAVDFISLSTPIFGNDTTLQAFDFDFTIPANSVDAGTQIQLTFGLQIESANPTVDQFRWGVEIGGSQNLSAVLTTLLPIDNINTVSATVGGFASLASPLPNLDFVSIVSQTSVLGSIGSNLLLMLNLSPTVPIPVRILWEWQAGANAGSKAFLQELGLTVIRRAP